MAVSEKTAKEVLSEYPGIMKKVHLLQFELGRIQPSDSANTAVTLEEDADAGADVRTRLRAQLDELLSVKNRLEYYVDLLDENTATLIRARYFEQYSWPDMVKHFEHPRSTLYDCIATGLETLAQMFDYTEDFLVD